jgi:hypothetical protein
VKQLNIGMRKLAVILILTSTLFSTAKAQQVLPDFSVVTKGNKKVIISWTNQYPVVTQISIQRSKDSTRGFATILTVPDPTAQQNGFVDAKAVDANQFYRLFVVQESGKFLFTKSKRATWDTAHVVVSKQNSDNGTRVVITESVSPRQAEEIKEKIKTTTPVVENKPVPVPEPEKFFIIKKRDTVLGQINTKDYKRFRDSVVTKTKDTIAFSSIDTILLKPFVPKEVYKPSKYIYTEKDGNITINLPFAGTTHHYSIKFFEDNNSPLFEIAEVKEPLLLIDKVNFLHSGWFKFELYEDGKLKEKHKLYIPKDF